MKILFVEDSEVEAKKMTEILSKTNHTLIIAKDGTEGFGEMALGGIDLVISDFQMPRMDGLTMMEFYEELKSKEIKKIMVTTDIRPELVERGKKLGVIAWFAKPLNKETVLNTLKELEDREKAS